MHLQSCCLDMRHITAKDDIGADVPFPFTAAQQTHFAIGRMIFVSCLFALLKVGCLVLFVHPDRVKKVGVMPMKCHEGRFGEHVQILQLPTCQIWLDL